MLLSLFATLFLIMLVPLKYACLGQQALVLLLVISPKYKRAFHGQWQRQQYYDAYRVVSGVCIVGKALVGLSKQYQ